MKRTERNDDILDDTKFFKEEPPIDPRIKKINYILGIPIIAMTTFLTVAGVGSIIQNGVPNTNEEVLACLFTVGAAAATRKAVQNVFFQK